MIKITCPDCGSSFELPSEQTAAILSQVRTEEFEREVNERVDILKRAYDSDKEKAVAEAVSAERDRLMQSASSEKEKLNQKIATLESDVRMAEAQKDLAIEKAINETKSSFMDQINTLNADNMMLTKEVELYKNMRTMQTTKATGEDLELFCEGEFHKIQAAGYPRAYFAKDNKVSATGSKGDYIFRDYDEDGTEYISIMFEMKNQTTSTNSAKKRNDVFFDELDKDRREKKCEYAVLVSLLEPDSEFYNQGICDVSYAHEKMYVVRPQFFTMIIGLLRNMARNTLGYKRQIKEYETRNIDMSRFEKGLHTATKGIVDDSNFMIKNYTNALASIDKSIDELTKSRDEIAKALKRAKLIARKADDLTLDNLTDGDSALEKLFISNEAPVDDD